MTVINHFADGSTGTTDRAITRNQAPTAYGLADEILGRKVVQFDGKENRNHDRGTEKAVNS